MSEHRPRTAKDDPVGRAADIEAAIDEILFRCMIHPKKEKRRALVVTLVKYVLLCELAVSGE